MSIAREKGGINTIVINELRSVENAIYVKGFPANPISIEEKNRILQKM